MEEENTKAVSFGEAVETAYAQALGQWAVTHRRGKSPEDAIANDIVQTTIEVIQRPGGRLTTHTLVTGKRHGTSDQYYERWQRIPDAGYVQVYKHERV